MDSPFKPSKKYYPEDVILNVYLKHKNKVALNNTKFCMLLENVLIVNNIFQNLEAF